MSTAALVKAPPMGTIKRRGVELDFIRRGNPVENAFIESFNGRLRDECLNVYSFESIAHPQGLIERCGAVAIR